MIGAGRWFNTALQHDANLAAGHAGLAGATTMAAVLLLVPPRKAAAEARAAAEQAVRLDNSLSEGHEALGRVHFFFDWAWDDAEREFRHALDLNPASVEAICGYASFLMYTDRPDEAHTQLDRAREIDPLSAYVLALAGLALYIARRYEDALVPCQQALDLDPTYPLAHWYLNWVHVARGKFEEALSQLDAVPERASRMIFHKGYLGATLFLAGRHAEALEVQRELVQRGQREYVAPIALAQISLVTGERDTLFRHMERAFEEGNPSVAILNMPPLDPLRSDPRFQALLRKIKFPAQAQ